MLPATLQFIIAMIAYSINERLQRKLDYAQEEVRVLSAATLENDAVDLPAIREH